jgi:hypothetical protein
LLYFEGATVVRLWTRGRVAFDSGTMHALLVLFGSYSLWTTSSVLLSAANRHRAMTWIYAAACAGGLALGYVLAGAYGLPGFVCGLAAADLAICGIWIPYMTCSMIGQSWKEYLAEVLGRGAAAVLPIIAAALLFHTLAPVASHIPRIAGLGLVTGASGTASLFFVWFSRGEKQQVAGLLQVFGRRSK